MDRSPDELLPVAVMPQALIERVAGAFDDLVPWQGHVPAERSRNFLGVLLPYVRATELPPGSMVPQATRRPDIRDGEGLAEYYAIRRSIDGASERYTMISLGAHFGGQLVNGAAMWRQLRGDRPVTLVGVEANPHMCDDLHRHFAANGFSRDQYSVVNAAIGANNQPMLFTVCDARTGAAKALHDAERPDELCNLIEKHCDPAKVLRRVLTAMSTDLEIALNDGDLKGRLDITSVLTIADVIGLHDTVDYLEMDIQSTEDVAVPASIDCMTRKVRWTLIGTHGGATHQKLSRLLRDKGWRVHIDLLPNTRYEGEAGGFTMNDGALCAENLRFGKR